MRFRPKLSEVDRLKCDNSLIKKKTKWRPRIDFKKGLEETIRWIKNNKEKNFTDIYRI
jgi:dTDP-glucose 4,6-dehydratase